MEKATIPYRNPNDFLNQFVSGDATHLLPKTTQTISGIYPAQNIFSLMRIEDFSKYIKFPITPGRSTVYEFCWLKKGKLIRTDGPHRYEIKESMISFYNCGNIKSTESCSEDAEGYYCLFDKEFILHFLKNQNSLDELPYFQNDGNPLIHLAEEDNFTVMQLLEKMEFEVVNNLDDKNRMIGIYLCQLLLHTKRLSSLSANKNNYSAPEVLTHKFLQLVNSNALTEKSVTFYANSLNVTANHLNRCVKNSTGKSAGTHIVDMVILEGKVLLKQTTLNISEIALRLGFDNTPYFSKLFKKQTGIAPSDYR